MYKIGTLGWIILAFIAIAIDIIQFILGFTIVGTAFNLASTPYIGLFFFAVLQLGGVSMIRHPLRLISLFGVPIIEGLTFGIAPLWIIDVWFIHRSFKKEKYRQQEMATFMNILNNMVKVPFINNGIRLPQNILRKIRSGRQNKNISGVRPPRKMGAKPEKYNEGSVETE